MVKVRVYDDGEGAVKELWPIGFALAFPVVCLLMILWLGRMEETLTRDVRRSERKPEPAPILRVPDRERPIVAPPQASEVSRSAALSLGGSTNL
jgi:hypothetical protein